MLHIKLLLRSVRNVTKQNPSVATDVFPYSFFLSVEAVKSFHKTSCKLIFPEFSALLLENYQLTDCGILKLCGMQLATSPDKSVK